MTAVPRGNETTIEAVAISQKKKKNAPETF
jgi:hypothetical protein